jgi:hypothetical protein
MKKPTVNELREYAEKIGFKEFDAEQFLAHYDSNGWRVGRVKMVSWRAAVVTWKKNAARFGRNQQQPPMTYRHRENKINYLNRRKAELMRQRRTPEVDRELARIQIELHKL